MKPNKQGQICTISELLQEGKPAETYIVIEDISDYRDGQTTYVVSITDLQRNIADPTLAPRKPVLISQLNVVADDLTSFVESWNKTKL